MDKIFLDCGAHCGCSRRKCRNDFPDYILQSFEPNPTFNKYCDKLINKAVWIYDGTVDFFQFDGMTAAGSSLIEKKAKFTSGGITKYQKRNVECINLARHIFSLNAEIILKMDIEGAEYAILPHLIDSGALNKVSSLYIEWHYTRCGVSKDEHDNLLSKINIPIYEWSGMRKDYCIKHMGINCKFEDIEC